MPPVSFWKLLSPLWFEQILCDFDRVNKTFGTVIMQKITKGSLICHFLCWLTLSMTFLYLPRENTSCSLGLPDM